jgi:1-pyrroline-5-carboxylate dehydrogenase
MPKTASATPRKKSAPLRVTYATMFDPPETLHVRFERALARARGSLGREYGMLIGGREVVCPDRFESRSPIDTDWRLGVFPAGGRVEAEAALAAAHAARPQWASRPWRARVRVLRRVAATIERRVYDIAAALALEVGKNRMEALGDAQEAADLIRYACDQMEANEGYVKQMGRDPLPGYRVTNTSILRPHGVWLVVSPFNFPAALSGGPAGAALLAGNTVVLKPATATPWSARLLAECFQVPGLPAGAFNFVTGSGGTLGQALVEDPRVDGITFTGSYEIGMRILRMTAGGPWPRPCIAEMGGKNAAVVSRRADLDAAAMGILRSAFGLQGQKCSATSRIFVERPVKEALIERLLARIGAISMGDPTRREHWMGPVINAGAVRRFEQCMAALGRAGRVLCGGRRATEGAAARGFFCPPTLVADVPLGHPLWQEEMFLPIAMLGAVDSLDEAMELVNSATFGLTAGFFGTKTEAARFFDRVQVGVAYANRPQGATTGAWPGFQPFGGWKGSGSSGKNGGGLYYLPLYMREQVQSLVEPRA